MSDDRRIRRVEREIQSIVGNFLIHNLRDSLHGLVSVAEVEANKDLRLAKVYLTVVGTDEDRQNNEGLLLEERSRIQKHLASTLKMKFCPVLKFFVNRSSGVVDSDLEKMLADLRVRS